MARVGAKRRHLSGLVVGMVVCSLLGCGRTSKTSGGNPSVNDGTSGAPPVLDSSFAVSDHFTPSSMLGDASVGHVATSVNKQCRERPPGAEGDCYRFDYKMGASLWAGVRWVFPSDNVGTVPGLELERSAFRRVRFSAAVLEGSEPIIFSIGNVDGRNAVPPQPHFDSFRAEGDFSVTSDWQSFSLDIPTVTPAEDPEGGLIGAFGWSMHFDSTDELPASKTLLLDDIVYE